MCDSMSPYFTNTGNNLPAYLGGTGPSHHEQYNGELQHHMMGPCHENGRGPPMGPSQLLSYSHQHPHHHQPIHYGHQQYPRFPPYDRLDGKLCAEGPSQAETSPYYSNCAASTAIPPPPPSQGPPPSLAPLPQPPAGAQYECTGRGSITPPSLDGSNGAGPYGNCKMQPMLPTHNDSMTALGGHNSPSPHHGQHQIYGNGPVGSPSQSSSSAIASPLYPWMRSQFGKSTHCWLISKLLSSGSYNHRKLGLFWGFLSICCTPSRLSNALAGNASM